MVNGQLYTIKVRIYCAIKHIIDGYKTRIFNLNQLVNILTLISKAGKCGRG